MTTVTVRPTPEVPKSSDPAPPAFIVRMCAPTQSRLTTLPPVFTEGQGASFKAPTITNVERGVRWERTGKHYRNQKETSGDVIGNSRGTRLSSFRSSCTPHDSTYRRDLYGAYTGHQLFHKIDKGSIRLERVCVLCFSLNLQYFFGCRLASDRSVLQTWCLTATVVNKG